MVGLTDDPRYLPKRHVRRFVYMPPALVSLGNEQARLPFGQPGLHPLALKGPMTPDVGAFQATRYRQSKGEVGGWTEGEGRGRAVPRSGTTGPLLASDGTSQLQHQHFKRKKNVHAWVQNVSNMIEKEGIDKTLCLRITPVSNDYEEASKAMNSLMSNWLSDEVKAYFCVPEWGDLRGHLHFHLIIIVPFDVGRLTFRHRGSNSGPIVAGNRFNANPRLRGFWSKLRARLPRYGFHMGHDCTPVKTDAYSVSRYLLAYMVKGISSRTEVQRGKRLFRASKGFSERYGVCSSLFSWVDDGGYRARLATYCRLRGYESLEDAKCWLGRSFQHSARDRIAATAPGDDPFGPCVPWHMRFANQLGLMHGQTIENRVSFVPDTSEDPF